MKVDDIMAEKCKNCGYEFKPEDGAICPSCLTPRHEDSIGVNPNSQGNQQQTYNQNNQPPYRNMNNNQGYNYQNYNPVVPKKTNKAVVTVVVVVSTLLVIMAIAYFVFIGNMVRTSITDSLNNGNSLSIEKEDAIHEVPSDEQDTEEYPDYDDIGDMSYKEYYKDYPINEHKILYGMSCELNDGLYISPSDIQDIGSDYMNYPTYDGYTLLAMNIELKNDSEYFNTFYQDLVLEGIDDDDYTEYYNVSYNGAFENQCGNVVYLIPGSTVNLTVYFEVPENYSGLQLAYYNPVYDNHYDDITKIDKYIFE